MKRNRLFIIASAFMLMTISCGTKNAQENTEVKEFETASEAVQKMAAGWNLGNSLDAFSSDIEPGSPIEKYETAWGQPATEDFLMKQQRPGDNPPQRIF